MTSIKPKLVVNHTRILINDYEIGDLPHIEKLFSTWDPAYYCWRPLAFRYDEESKTLYLPRGADIQRLESALGVPAMVDRTADPVTHVEPSSIKYKPRDETQETAIRFLLGKAEFEYTRSKSRIALNLGTGKGKTYLSIAASAFFGVRMAMITSNIGWIEQWGLKISEYTNDTKKNIYIIQGKDSIDMVLNGRKDISDIKYVLCSHGTLRSYGEQNGWHKVSELFKIMGIGLKIYDEAHLDFENICRIDFATNTRKTIYLTATPERSDRKENKIYKIAFNDAPSLSLFDDKEDPRTHYVAFHYNSCPSSVDIGKCSGRYGFNKLAYVDYLSTNENFYKMLFIILEIVKSKGKTLIFIGKIDLIETVYQWIMFNFPEYAGQVGRYHSKVPEYIDKEAELDKMVILSTVKSLGAAKDIDGLMLTVNIGDPFANDIATKQTLGRTRAYDSMYIDVIDTGFSTLRNYYKHKIPIYAKYALDIQDVIFRSTGLDEKYQQLLQNKMEFYNKLYNVQDDSRLVIARKVKK